jgi:hypothetical protein
MTIHCPHCGGIVSTVKKRKKGNMNPLKSGNAKAYYTDKYSQTPKISNKRLDNILFHYPDIEWIKDSWKITIPGHGDKPGFSIDGLLDGMKVQFHTNTPGGGSARMYYWIEKKRKVLTFASFLRAEEITAELRYQAYLNS